MYKVAIIEDETIIRKGLVHNISWKEFNCVVVAEADNGEDGLDIIKRIKPNIVLVDINIPIINGLEMLEKTKHLNDLSIIIISGSNDFENAKKAIQLGAIRYLGKPINKEELKEAILLAINKQKNKKILKTSKSNLNEFLANNNIDFSEMEINTNNQIVSDMLNYIHENFNKPIIMRDLVEELNYSETFLNRNFKQETGLTFNRYLVTYRINQSVAMLLDNPQQSIKEISDKCGFSDYKYFHTVFKKEVGTGPKQFIEKILTIYH